MKRYEKTRRNADCRLVMKKCEILRKFLISLGYESAPQTTGWFRVRSLPGVAGPPRSDRRRQSDQARRARLRRADGADRGAGSRRQQGCAEGAGLAKPDCRGQQSGGPDCRIAQSVRIGARADPHGRRAWLPIHRRDPASVSCHRRDARCDHGGGSRVDPTADQPA